MCAPLAYSDVFFPFFFRALASTIPSYYTIRMSEVFHRFFDDENIYMRRSMAIEMKHSCPEETRAGHMLLREREREREIFFLYALHACFYFGEWETLMILVLFFLFGVSGISRNLGWNDNDITMMSLRTRNSIVILYELLQINRFIPFGDCQLLRTIDQNYFIARKNCDIRSIIIENYSRHYLIISSLSFTNSNFFFIILLRNKILKKLSKKRNL